VITRTGYGYHADYMMGWPEDVLNQAMQTCTDSSGQVSACKNLHTRSIQDMNDCAIAARVDERVDGCKYSAFCLRITDTDTLSAGLSALPGCQPVQPGPARATPVSGCGAPTATQKPGDVSFLKKIDGWQAVGCAASSSFSGQATTSSSMTVESCLNTCVGKNMKFAGLSNGNTCTCASSFNTGGVSSSYACNLACSGDAACQYLELE
jgi:hypothetical protein